MANYVLVHGAWHGGWCWRAVQRLLQGQNHLVLTPTMTGHGERTHLMSDNITMDTVVTDIVNVLAFEDLSNVILVGHSFGGAVISGVAEQCADRIEQLIYLDAAVLEDGESMYTQLGPEVAAQREEQAQASSNGISFPIPSSFALGIEDAEQWAPTHPRLTPQPCSTYKSALRLKNRPGKGFRCSYIACTHPTYEPLSWARRRVREYGWPMISIAAGHDAMITSPEVLAETLLQLSRPKIFSASA